MSDDVGGLGFAALLGVPFGDKDIAEIAVPTGADAVTYRAELKSRLEAVAEQRAAGQQDAASVAVDQLIASHRAAIAAAPKADPAGDFVAFLNRAFTRGDE